MPKTIDHPPDLPIVAAASDDFLAIAALDRDSWTDSPDDPFVADGEHVWKIWCEQALVFVAKGDGGTVVGAALAFPVLDGSFCLHKIMIAPDHRGRGLGSRLMNAILDALDGLKKACFLTVDPKNSAAIRLYQKRGFVIARTLRDYYGAAKDRHIMTRDPGSAGALPPR